MIPSATKNYIHTSWKVGPRLLLTCGRKLECSSMGQQSDYAFQTVQHELEPIKPAKLENHESPAAIHHNMEIYAPAWASVGPEGTARCMSREPRPPCHQLQFYQHPAPSSYLCCTRGERRHPVWSNERGGKCPSVVYRWIGSACASQKWHGSCITFPLQSGNYKITKGESSQWVVCYVVFLVIFTLCESKNSLRWNIYTLLGGENGLSG